MAKGVVCLFSVIIRTIKNERKYYAKLRREQSQKRPKTNALGIKPTDPIADKQAIARDLKALATPAEKKIRRYLTSPAWKFQWVISGYIADFCHPSAKLVVEIDGAVHKARKWQDARRTRHLEAKGYKVIRFTNSEVFADTKGVADKCWQVVRELKGQQ